MDRLHEITIPDTHPDHYNNELDRDFILYPTSFLNILNRRMVKGTQGSAPSLVMGLPEGFSVLLMSLPKTQNLLLRFLHFR